MVEFSHDPVPLLQWGHGRAPLAISLPDDLNTAVAKRQAEFLAGRLCAALALQDLGLPTEVKRQGRAPIWPEGCAGSITHSDHVAIAAVSRHYAQLGIDCETLMSDARAAKIARMIYRPAEAELRPSTLGLGAFTSLVFSAKEAFYKAVSAQVGRVLEFHEVTLISLGTEVLHLEFEGQSHQVHWRFAPLSSKENHCVTLYVAAQ